MSELIFRYFPLLSESQKDKLARLKQIYDEWNKMINVISRKDMDNFYIHHVLHSMSLAKVITFIPKTRILDVGTGGGLPGIPLALCLPQCQVMLLDSKTKKIAFLKQALLTLKINNASELRGKETDRIYAICQNMKILGLDVEEYDDGFAFSSEIKDHSPVFESFGDHRIAMAFGILSLILSSFLWIYELILNNKKRKAVKEFTQIRLNLETAVLPGKPTVVASFDDPVTSRKFDVDVAITKM